MLSMMAQGFFSQSSLLILPIIALFIFMAVFALVTLRVLRTDKESLQVLAGLPLDEDSNRQSDGGQRR